MSDQPPENPEPPPPQQPQPPLPDAPPPKPPPRFLVPTYTGPVVPDYQNAPSAGDSTFLQILGGFVGYLGLFLAACIVGPSAATYSWWFWLAPIVAFTLFAIITLLLRKPIAFLTGLITFVLNLILCSACGMLLRGI